MESTANQMRTNRDMKTHLKSPNLVFISNQFLKPAIKNWRGASQSSFILHKAMSPDEYNDCLKAFCRESQNQDLEYRFLTSKNFHLSIQLTKEEEAYIVAIGSVCLPVQSYPSWFKEEIKKDVSLTECFLESVKRTVEGRAAFIYEKIYTNSR